MRPLPPIQVGNRAVALAAGYALFCVLYLGSFAVSHPRAVYLAPGWLDLALPAWPGSLWLYLSQFILLPLAFALETRSERLTHAFYAMLTATLVSCAVFVLWPTTVGQTMPTAPADPTGVAWRWLYTLDVPGNCFPSLHVALAALAAWLLAGRGGPWRIAAPVWALAIAVSVVTTRQHRAIDVAGGLAVALLAAWVVRRLPMVIPTERLHAQR